MLVKRKDFEKIFSEIATENKKIWAVSKVEELDKDIIDITIRLFGLDFINYVKITNETIIASSERKETGNKSLITTMNHPTAVGIEILYNCTHKYLSFYEINSPIKRNGSKMISAVLTNLPQSWILAILMDWSEGFWEKMVEKYSEREWITQ
jgi:hypothetical protein